MDIAVRLPVIWIISAVALLGAYKRGKLGFASKLKKAEGQPVGSEDSDCASTDKEESGSEDESKEEPRQGSNGALGGEKKSKKSAESTSKSKAKEGKLKNVKGDDWEWPVYDLWWNSDTDSYNRKLRQQKEKKVQPDESPFEVTYKRRPYRPDQVRVKLRSEPLIRIARKCLSKHIEKLIIEEPVISGRKLYIALNSFEQEYRSVQPEDDPPLIKYHLKHLIRFLKREYKDTIVLLKRMRREKVVRWDLLWAFLHKGERVYYTCAMTGQRLHGVVWRYHYANKEQPNHEFFRVELRCCNYNGKKLVKSKVIIDLTEFKGENSFESIGICPFSMLEESEVEDLEEMFLRNGKRFYQIVSQGSRYMQYKGSRLYKVRKQSGWELEKQNADGRVMVDLLSFARMNPQYPLNDAAPTWVSSSPHIPTCMDTEMPSDDDLRLAPAVVFGFSFANKRWGGFDINGLSKIQFDSQAFDRDLVLMNSARKQMLLALVKQYVGHTEGTDVPNLDPITNKGNGCTFLCYGPPGTGKTLTAESIAEKLERPLWAISVFELGTTPKELELNLRGILEVAAQWRAVLLLDEADVYMEKRTSNGDPTRTAMIAIFLRLLEYYRGVLFLTTNRVASFDDAFCSRISMFLRYQRLSGDQRKAIWSNLFARAGVQNPDLAPFVETPLNGREICNAIRIAQAWAKSSGEELTTRHVQEVVNMLGEFCKDLEEDIKYETDERSITRALHKVRSMKISRDTSELDNGHFLRGASTNDH